MAAWLRRAAETADKRTVGSFECLGLKLAERNRNVAGVGRYASHLRQDMQDRLNVGEAICDG